MIWNERIKTLRIQSKKTLQEVAKAIGVSEATAQRYESKNGIKNIPYESIIGYSKIFGVSPSYIMGWEEPKTENPTLSDKGYQIGLAYDKADERTKIGVEVALGIDFEKKNVEVRLSS